MLRDATKVRESIGVVFQAPSSDDILTGYENLKIHALLYGIPRGNKGEKNFRGVRISGIGRKKKRPGKEIFWRHEKKIGNSTRTLASTQESFF